ncbi:MAG: DUF3179 domain-containing protein [Gammaproteobacteria bacterium]
MIRLTLIFLLLIPLALGSPPAAAQTKNGFDLSDALVPAAEILAGGPPRDGIPAIHQPRFLPAAQARHLAPGDRVLGISRNGVAKAYPLAILNWHEIVNDRLGKESVVITFCPLCGSGVAFSARVRDKARHFGVSGLLYNSDVLLYDRETESLWSQLLGQAVSGPLKGARLQPLPLVHTTWGAWRRRHPDTLVLSRDTGYARDYDRDPYAGYVNSRGVFFPVRHKDPRFHPKERVLGLEIAGQAKAWPFSELARSRGVITDRLGAQPLRIRFDAENQTAFAEDEAGNALPATVLFWFAWYAFHPDTELFTNLESQK